MLQEMELKKALKAHMSGREVLVMTIGTTDGSGGITVDKMDEHFAGCRFLVEVAATIDPEFEAAVQEMISQFPPPNTSNQLRSLPPTPINQPPAMRSGKKR